MISPMNTVAFAGVVVAFAALPAVHRAAPCSLLTQAQVGSALGQTVDPGEPLGPKTCMWKVPNQPNSLAGKKLSLTVNPAANFTYAKSPVVKTTKTTPLSGVGDDAIYNTIAGGTPGYLTSLIVKKGDVSFIVRVTGFSDLTQAMAIEKALALNVLSKL